MIEVDRISMPKHCLEAMPKAERTLLLLMGHTSNQITALARVLEFYRRNTPSSDAEKEINTAQIHMFARFLIGVVFEGWLLIERRLLRSKLGKEYIPQLEAPAREALNALKGQFGGSILAKLRNNVAFHNPSDAAVEAGFQAGIANPHFDILWNWYIADATWCAYSVMSDLVVSNCMLTLVGTPDEETFRRVKLEVQKASSEMMMLFTPLSALFLLKFCGTQIQRTKLQIEGTPLSSIKVPFFVEVDDDG